MVSTPAKKSLTTRFTSCRCRVGSISADHVIDSCHVDGIVAIPTTAAEIIEAIHGSGGPVLAQAKPKSSIGKQGAVYQPPESRLVLHLFVAGLTFRSAMFSDDWEEAEPGDEVSNTNRNESQALCTVPKPHCFIDQTERLDEHKNQSIAEATEKRQCKNDRLSKEHFEGSNPVTRISLAENRSLKGTSSSGPHIFLSWPLLRRFLAILPIIMVVRVSGTRTRCRI